MSTTAEWRLNLQLIQSQCTSRRRTYSYKKWDFNGKLSIIESLVVQILHEVVLTTRIIAFYEDDALRLYGCDSNYGCWKCPSTNNSKSFGTKIWTASFKTNIRWAFFSILCLGKRISLTSQRNARPKMFRFFNESVSPFIS